MKRACGMDSQLLWEYSEGFLAEPRRGSVAEHVAGCAECRKALADDVAVFATLQSARPDMGAVSARRFLAPIAVGVPGRSLWRWPVAVIALGALAYFVAAVFHEAPVSHTDSRATTPAEVAKKATPGAATAGPTVAANGKHVEAKHPSTPPGGVAVPSIGSGWTADAPTAGGLRRAREADTGVVRTEAKDRLTEPSGDMRNGTAATTPGGPVAGFRGGTGGGAGAGGFGGRRVGGGFDKEKDGVLSESYAAKRPHWYAYVEAYDSDHLVQGISRMTLLDSSDKVNWVADEMASNKGGQPRGKADVTLSTEPALARYLTQSVDLDVARVPLTVVFADLAAQTNVPVEVAPAVAQNVVTAKFKGAPLSVALANIAVASQVQWRDTGRRIRVEPLPMVQHLLGAIVQQNQGKAQQRNSKPNQNQQMQNTRKTRMQGMTFEYGVPATNSLNRQQNFDPVCPHCGRPNLGPTWQYCPFCGQPLKR